MKLILLSENGRQSHTVDTQKTHVKLIATVALLLLLLVGAAISQLFNYRVSSQSELEGRTLWQQNIAQNENMLNEMQQQVQDEVNALTARVANLKAGMMRLDALGEQVAQIAKLDNGEFDFSRPPALGGPELLVSKVDAVAGHRSVYQILAEMEALLEDRTGQFSVLGEQLVAREMQHDAFVTGRPIKRGWMSSRFGHRTDPFSGKQAWHNGVDFAGKSGADVISVAAGVVTFAGSRYGYGQIIEVNHGNGFETRYAHNKTNLVKKGDVVKKGQAIAEMGNTGRSTGPHVHFEVLKNGKAANPERYIHRASL